MFKIKNYSRFFIFLVLIIFISSIAVVSASDLNETAGDEIQVSNAIEVEQYADESPINEETNVDDDLINLSECSSIVLHVSDNEGVISVRRDATNPVDLIIESGYWGNIEYQKQYKNPDGYFAHAIVTSNGWLIGNGGITDGSIFRQIESIASEMVVNNVISDAYLSRIYNIMSGYSLGHFVIKAADGTYGVVFNNLYHVGKLEPGQFVVCPNVYSMSQKGTYDSSLSPVDAAIKLGYTDSYGVNRRNLMTYHWKLTKSPNGLAYSVDSYASNDNGAGCGRSTASLADNFYYYNEYISRNSLPVTPNKKYLGTHIFDKSSIEIFKLLSPLTSTVVGQNIEIKFQVKYIPHTTPLVKFAIPEGFEFNSASVSKGTYVFADDSSIVVWSLTDCDANNFITLSLKAVKSGQYDLLYALNEDFVNSVKLTVNEYGALISAADVNKYCRGPEKLNIYLTDVANHAIVGEKVIININGVDYTRTTNENGLASIAINLDPGDYPITASYNGAFGANSTSANVHILSTVSGDDIVKMYKNGTHYYAKFKDTSGNPLVNGDVTFNINGVFYNRKTDATGQAKLNINLNPGKYVITAINTINGEQHANVVEVLPVLVDGHDLTKYYRNDSVYSIKVLDDVGNPLPGVDVVFNINGVFYTRTSNATGYANLNLRLQPDQYIVTAEYNTFMSSNIITVLPVLFANNTVSYTNESNFRVKLIDGQGNPYANQSIEFNINGAIYNNVTDDEGIASLFINLVDGEYVVTSTYDEYSIANTITIKNGA